MSGQEWGSATELGEALEARLAELQRKALWIEASWNHAGPVARRLAYLMWRWLRALVVREGRP